MIIFLWILLAAWLVRAIDLIVGAVFLVPILKERPFEGKLPKVSLIFAARNEGGRIRAAVESMVSQDYPDIEVIAVNDRSTDDTASELAAVHDPHRRLRVLTIEALPAGWLGKTHALFQGYRASSGEWFLFTDADVHFAPGAVRAAVAEAEKRRLGHLTLMPELIIGRAIEAAFTNYFALQFNLRYRPWMARFSWALSYVGIGAFNLVRREAYEKAGTHERLALDIADDVMLGKIIKRAGFRSMLMGAGGLVKVRWVEGFRGVLSSLHKNAFRGLEYNIFLLLGATVVLPAFDVLPFVGLFIFHVTAFWFCAAMTAAIFSVYAASAKFSRHSLQTFLAHPFVSLLFIFILWRSAVSALRQGGVRWRDTFYPLKALKAARV